MKNIIIPTYNEVENIGVLIDAIHSVMSESALSIIVVDDDSTDGTQDVVRDRASRSRSVRLFVRHNQRGLGSAVRFGASHVVSGPVVVMDADLSHHPEYLPTIFNGLENGYDIVVGSRYIPGGRVLGWPGSRIAISRIATSIGNTLLRIRVRDSMSGFVGCRDARMLQNGIRYADYKFLLELLVKYRGVRVLEIPIVFRNRCRGSSKLGHRTILRYLYLVMRLIIWSMMQRYHRSRDMSGHAGAR